MKLRLLLVFLFSWLMSFAQSDLSVATIADLKLITGTANQTARLLGRYSANDGAEGTFVYLSTSTAVSDDVLAVKPTAVSGTGRWVRIVNNNEYYANWWGLSTSSDMTPLLNSVFNIVPNKATVIFDGRTYTITGKIYMYKPVTVQGRGSTIVYTGATGVLVMSLRSSDITINALNFKTNNTTIGLPYVSGSVFIGTESNTNAAFYQNIEVSNCRLENYNAEAISISYARGVRVLNNYIRNFAYGGAVGFSVVDGRYAYNEIADITGKVVESDGGVNCYGIQMSVRGSGSTDTVPRNITIENNIVRRVNWEAIDTHGGDYFTISHNYIDNCATGIAVVSAASSTTGFRKAPQHFKVINNQTFNTGNLNKSAIRVDGLELESTKATGIISNNTCFGGAIKISDTRGVIISNNVVERSPNGASIQLNGNCYTTLIQGNSLIDAYYYLPETGNYGDNSSAIGYFNGNNHAVVVNNSIIRSTLTIAGAKINNYAFYGVSAATDDLIVGQNDFSGITTSIFRNGVALSPNIRFLQPTLVKLYNASPMTVGPEDAISIYGGTTSATVALPAITNITNGRVLTIRNASGSSLTSSIPIYSTGTVSSTSIPAGTSITILYDKKNNKVWKQ